MLDEPIHQEQTSSNLRFGIQSLQQVGWLVNNLLWLTEVVLHLLKMTRKNLTKTDELAVLGSTVSLKWCVLYVQQCCQLKQLSLSFLMMPYFSYLAC